MQLGFKYNNIDTEWVAAMRNDIALLMQCDTIVMLQGWEQSKGAQIEHFIAILLNFNIIYDDNKKVDITDAIIKKNMCFGRKKHQSNKMSFA